MGFAAPTLRGAAAGRCRAAAGRGRAADGRGREPDDRGRPSCHTVDLRTFADRSRAMVRRNQQIRAELSAARHEVGPRMASSARRNRRTFTTRPSGTDTEDPAVVAGPSTSHSATRVAGCDRIDPKPAHIATGAMPGAAARTGSNPGSQPRLAPRGLLDGGVWQPRVVLRRCGSAPPRFCAAAVLRRRGSAVRAP